ncbi:hypothetical protein B0H19DRAFT_1199001 [Mycena capillaripes]|nr:hypothetical protein B0H19DRAFT_1199001 [Mycena capillaripes]
MRCPYVPMHLRCTYVAALNPRHHPYSVRRPAPLPSVRPLLAFAPTLVPTSFVPARTPRRYRTTIATFIPNSRATAHLPTYLRRNSPTPSADYVNLRPSYVVFLRAIYAPRPD